MGPVSSLQGQVELGPRITRKIMQFGTELYALNHVVLTCTSDICLCQSAVKLNSTQFCGIVKCTRPFLVECQAALSRIMHRARGKTFAALIRDYRVTCVRWSFGADCSDDVFQGLS
jgi:hypothetical protein